MFEYTIGKFTSKNPLPIELKGIISAQEFGDTVNDFKLKIKRMPILVPLAIMVVSILCIIIRYIKLNDTLYLKGMGFLIGIEFSILAFVLIFYISNKVELNRLIYSLNQQYQYRYISFSSSSLFGFELKMTYDRNGASKNSTSETSSLIG
ncbi:hypothetical protein ACTFIW_005265 [Dictyostelium discoideum]